MDQEIIQFRPKPLPAKPAGPEPITPLNYDQRVLSFAQASGLSEFPTIKLGTPEFNAWMRYFDEHLRWRPWIFKALVGGQKQTMTVPTQWPEWFDLQFAGSDAPQ